MITALIIGFVTGWLISMPIGPVSASVISRTLRYGARNGLFVSIGAGVMDFIYCGGAAQIHEFLQASPLINLIFQITGLVVLVLVGIKTLTQRTTPDEEVAESDRESQREAEKKVKRLHIKQTGFFAPFVMGVILYASNVAAVPEWIFISALWRENGILEEGVLVNLFFALGAGLGTLGWGYFLVRFIERRRRGFKPAFLAKINLVAGGALLLFGLYFGYKIVFDTQWELVAQSWNANVLGKL
ncbi:MAG TPA: LysE family transporter [Candidatus Kapabacteria bacterium]|nr:LysE family transporter [Candidatus Kapabacteria bacterium]